MYILVLENTEDLETQVLRYDENLSELQREQSNLEWALRQREEFIVSIRKTFDDNCGE